MIKKLIIRYCYCLFVIVFCTKKLIMFCIINCYFAFNDNFSNNKYLLFLIFLKSYYTACIIQFDTDV